MSTTILEEIEQGLTDKDWTVRWNFAVRKDYTPTTEQVERGLTDDHWVVRLAFTERTDFTPTPAELARVMASSQPWHVLFHIWKVFVLQEAELQKKLEVRELRERHASVTATNPTLDAL